MENFSQDMQNGVSATESMSDLSTESVTGSSMSGSDDVAVTPLCFDCRTLRLDELLDLAELSRTGVRNAYHRKIVTVAGWTCGLCRLLDAIVPCPSGSDACDKLPRSPVIGRLLASHTYERHIVLHPVEQLARGTFPGEGLSLLGCKNIAHRGEQNEHVWHVPGYNPKSSIEGIIGLAAKDGTYAARYIPRRLVSSDRICPDAVATLGNWLETCDERHLNCRRSISGEVVEPDPPMPTRVVDVGVGDGCRIRIRKTHGKRGVYLALSHCWGGTFFRLTTENHRQYEKEGFELEELPRTLQDAIVLTRALDLQYIWIDSLCIIQDSIEDWDQESRNMGQVYENAYCTVAATLAPDDDTGFLHGPSVRYAEVPCDLGDVERETYFVTEPYRSEFKQVEKARLNHRGWVVQERLLSRRTMHFAQDQVFWECRQCILGEDGSQHRPGAEGLAGLARSISELKDDRDKPRGGAMWEADEREQTFVRRWQGIIATYSACAFTESSDRLPALLGLAGRLDSINEIEYHYGNWINPRSDYPPRALAWWACEPGKKRRKGRVRAPTWSWSALEGEVYFEQQDRRPLVRLVSVDLVECAGLDRYVALKMRGRFCKVATLRPRVRVAELYPVDWESRGHGIVGHVTFDRAINDPVQLDCLLLYVDSADSPTMLALVQEETADSDGRVAAYRRLGIGSIKRQIGQMAFGDEVEFLLI